MFFLPPLWQGGRRREIPAPYTILQNPRFLFTEKNLRKDRIRLFFAYCAKKRAIRRGAA